MEPAAVALLSCPRCRGRLELRDRSLRCASGHSFDLARQGYVNLLGGPEPANADTAAMLAARARVLAAGLFEPVAAELARLASGPHLLEVGAGTAYYLARARGADPAGVGVALDVSKAAAKAAARADPRITAVVADVWRPLPLGDGAVDAVLCVFAPRNLAEFARVLRPGGRLVVATPNPGHLAEVRDRHQLLTIPPAKADGLAVATAGQFQPVASRRVRHSAELAATQVADLIAMGPNAFHGLPERVMAQRVTIDVTVQAFATCQVDPSAAKMGG